MAAICLRQWVPKRAMPRVAVWSAARPNSSEVVGTSLAILAAFDWITVPAGRRCAAVLTFRSPLRLPARHPLIWA